MNVSSKKSINMPSKLVEDCRKLESVSCSTYLRLGDSISCILGNEDALNDLFHT